MMAVGSGFAFMLSVKSQHDTAFHKDTAQPGRRIP